ncbi:guanylate-binding protein 2-like [Ruditapes philippinarum]|uniref:guanylate-binding protein 2-like n=1 Tax=Ruditapes philippinarum TaxID=129788 RepID=UPI00295BFE01|nr:guanylate-binding protein 2-like [Ruditapes philippinarum]
MSENLRISVTDKTDDNFDLLMPDFVLCIRDFTLDLVIDGKECNEDEYIEHCLKEKRTETGKLDQAYNRPRQCIKKYFTNRKAFTFDIPAQRQTMKNLALAKEEALSSDFVCETKKFTEYIYKRPVKMLQNRKPVSGRMLQGLLDCFVTSVKIGAVPCIDDALTIMSKQENEKHAKDAIDRFHDELGKLKMPVGNKTQLIEKKFSFQYSILADLNSKLLFDEDHVVEMAVKAETENIFKEFEAKNDKKVYEKCLMRITDIYQKVERNIDKRTYIVSGGFEKYKRDMQSVVEMYENEQDNEQTDRMQVIAINKAKRDFLATRQSESEAIMIDDKSISYQEQKVELEKRQKKLEADFKEAQEKALKHSQEELGRQRKQHDEQLAIVRKAQEEREAANKAEFFEEKLARRDAEISDMAKKIRLLEWKSNLESAQHAQQVVHAQPSQSAQLAHSRKNDCPLS